MSGVYLESILMKRESKSYTDSLHAILTAARLFNGPKYMLSGLSGMAFKFTVHERLLHLSVSAYGQWGNEHQPAVDNLGLFTIWDGGRTRHPTFRHYQKDAVEGVKSCLDRGIGTIYWIPEFGVIHGYDDDDHVFYLQDGSSREDKVVLYDNFGLNFTPFWYFQVFGKKVDIPLEIMVLESLRSAIRDWDTPYKTLPNTDIASGKLAYTFLIRGLDCGDFEEGGAVYILDSYVYSRVEIRNYLRDVGDIWNELYKACSLYEQLVQTISGIENCMNTSEGFRQVNRKEIPALIEILQVAESLEDQAIQLFRAISERHPDRKRSVIPRWGAHSAR